MVSVAETVIFEATWLYKIPLFAVALAVLVFPFPKRPNSLCVHVASQAAKNAVTYATAPENVVDDCAFLTTSVPS